MKLAETARPLDPATAARVDVDMVDNLYRFPLRVFANVINSGITVGVLWGALSTTLLLTWFGLACLVTLGRYGLSLAYRRAKPGVGASKRWAGFYMIGSCLAAALWGAASCTIWITPDIVYPVFVAFAVAGTCAAATAMSNAHLPTAHSFVVLAAGTLSVNLIIAAQALYVSMGVMGLLFTALLMAQARVSNRILRDTVLLKEENRALVADFSAARDGLEEKVRERTAELAATNAALEAEMGARQEAEGQLRQAQKMEAVGQLTGGIAHDFNNILGVVLGNLDLVALSLKTDDRQMALLRRAIEAAERGANLTHRLLAFSRRQTLVTEVTDINALTTGLTALLQQALGDSIRLHLRQSADLWRSTVDPNQLENAILNLAINARDAMPNGGELTIETKNVVLDAVALKDTDIRSGDYVLLAVGDTGTGMTQDVLERALEPFFTTKGVGKGTGLGLSMVYGFVKQSGGHVEIESALGRGTTVKLYLPRAAAVQTAEVTVAVA